MLRTRKRDDDSQYNNSINSDATSLAALDASSMSATGSRSSLTFASSKKNGKHQHQRPRKRHRKSLTDALQSISLDKDRGVPEQILKNFPFSKSVTFTNATNTGGNCNSIPVFGASGTHNNLNNLNNLNSQQQLHRQLDREDGADGDGDIYFDDDDNSQLTSSTEGIEAEGDEGMEDDYDDNNNDEEDDEDTQTKKISQMTDIEKAQREVMLSLVFGKDHRESKKTKGNVTCVLAPPTLITPASFTLTSPPPFATIFTAVENPTTKTSTTTQKAASITSTTTEQGDEDEDDYKDPADRKIEQLLRRSLENIREGSHPLQLPKPSTTKNEDDDLFVTTPWKTQDDMTIDPQIYSPRVTAAYSSISMPGQHKSTVNSNRFNPKNSMALEGSNFTKPPNSNAPVAGAQPQLPPARARSNSVPDGLNMMDSTAMEMDG